VCLVVQILNILSIHQKRDRYPMGGISKFLQIFLLNPNFLLIQRNRNLEGMDDRQKTPRGHPDFNSYLKIQRVFIDNGWTNRQTDREIHLLHMGWKNLFSSCAVCCDSFWFWWEIGVGLHTHVLRVQYSCGVVLGFWLRREIVFGVTYILSVQYSCAVVSVFWL
jgi:hypothetical protein